MYVNARFQRMGNWLKHAALMLHSRPRPLEVCCNLLISNLLETDMNTTQILDDNHDFAQFYAICRHEINMDGLISRIA